MTAFRGSCPPSVRVGCGDAYRIVQESAQEAWDRGVQLRELLERQQLGLDLDTVFDESHYTRHAAAIVDRLDAIA